MRRKSVCLSAPFSTFPVARSQTPTAAFESLGLISVPFTLPPTYLTGSLRGQGLSCRVFFSCWFCQVRHLVNDGHLKVTAYGFKAGHEFHSLCDMCRCHRIVLAIRSVAPSARYYDRVPRTAYNPSQTLACIHFTSKVTRPWGGYFASIYKKQKVTEGLVIHTSQQNISDTLWLNSGNVWRQHSSICLDNQYFAKQLLIVCLIGIIVKLCKASSIDETANQSIPYLCICKQTDPLI